MPSAVRSPSAKLVCHIVEAVSYVLMKPAASNSSLLAVAMCDSIVSRCTFTCARLYRGSLYARPTAPCMSDVVCLCRKSSIVAANMRGGIV